MPSTRWGSGGGQALPGGAQGSGGDQLAGQGIPCPNACSKGGGQKPRSWIGFSVRGAAGWSPFFRLGPTVLWGGPAALTPQRPRTLRATGEAVK